MYAHDQYRSQATTTASPAQLVLMLYDGALSRIARAEAALEGEPDHGQAHESLTRAQAIVDELALSLDHERGGQIAGNLASLYRYCSEQLIEANVTKDAASLPGVTSVLTELRDAWEQGCVHAPAAVSVG